MPVLRARNAIEVLQIVLLGKVGPACIKAEFERERQRSIAFPEAVPSAGSGGRGSAGGRAAIPTKCHRSARASRNCGRCR